MCQQVPDLYQNPGGDGNRFPTIPEHCGSTTDERGKTADHTPVTHTTSFDHDGQPDRLYGPPCDGSLVTVIGASARATAASAARSGWRVRAADLFDDVDLRRYCDETWRCEHAYPAGLAPFVADGPDAPWVYTGGLENAPELVDRLSRVRPLWGNGGGVLRGVRDPFRLSEVLRENGFQMPRLSRTPPRAGAAAWLRKSQGGCGGSGITACGVAPEPVAAKAVRHQHSDRDEQLGRRGYYYQHRARGAPFSAVFVGRAGGAVLIGATRQLVGVDWLHAPPFGWCGGLGPQPIAAAWREELQRLGDTLVASFHLRGLFGVDFIAREESLLTPAPRAELAVLEVNPRYPASAEILELSTEPHLFDLHADACRAAGRQTTATPAAQITVESGHHVVGKAVLFAPARCIIETDLLSHSRNGAGCCRVEVGGMLSEPRYADVPSIGTIIESRHPILTLLDLAETESACLESLQRRVRSFLASTQIRRRPHR